MLAVFVSLLRNGSASHNEFKKHRRADAQSGSTKHLSHSYIKESDLYLSVSCRHTRSVIRTHTYCGASQEPAERGHEGKAGRRKPGSPQASPRGQAGGENVRAHQRAPLHVGRRLGRRTKQNTPLGASSNPSGMHAPKTATTLARARLARHRSLGAQRRLEQVDVHLFHTAAAVNGAISQRHLAQRSTRTVVASGGGARPLYQPPSSKAAKQAGGRSGGGPASQAHDSTWCNCNRRSGSTSSMPSSTSTSGGEKWHSRS